MGYWLVATIILMMVINTVSAAASIVYVKGSSIGASAWYAAQIKGDNSISCPDGYVMIGFESSICNGQPPTINSTINPTSLSCPSSNISYYYNGSNYVYPGIYCAKGCFDSPTPNVTVNSNPNGYPLILTEGRHGNSFYGNVGSHYALGYIRNLFSTDVCPNGSYMIDPGAYFGGKGSCIYK